MGEEEYEEYEEYYEDGSRNKRLWIILFGVALIAALVFGTLWYLRGGDMDRLNAAIVANQSASDAANARLERELDTVRNDAESGKRKIDELEKRIRDEQRRATEMAQQVERRLRDEADSANARALTLSAEVTQLKAELEAGGATAIGTGEAAGIAAGAGAAALLPLKTELENVKRQLSDARESAEAREKELYQRLADAVKEKDELAGTVGDLKASLNNIGLELTTANEDLKGVDTVREQAGALQKELDEAKATIKTLEEKIGDLEANNSHLRGELTSAQEDLEKHQAQLSNAEKELSGATTRIQALSLQSAEPDSDQSRFRAELAAGAAAAGAAAVKIHGLEAKIIKLENTLESLKQEHTTLQSTHSDLKATLTQAETVKTQTENELNRVKTDLARTGEELLSARAGAQEVERLRGENDAARKTVEALQGQVATYETEQSRLRGDLSELGLQLQQARSESAKTGLLEGELDAAKKAAEDSAAEVRDLAQKQTDLRKDLAAAYADLKKARESGGDSATTQSELDNRITALSAELDAARKNHGTAQEATRSLQAELDQVRADAKEQEKSLRDAIERLERENREALDRLETWKKSAPKPDAAEQVSVGSAVHEAIAKLEAEAGNELPGATAAEKVEKLVGKLENDNSALRKELSDANAEVGKARENAAKNLIAVRQEYDERLSNERKRLNERIDVLRDQYEKAKEEANRVKEALKEKIGTVPTDVEIGEGGMPLSKTPAKSSGILSLSETLAGAALSTAVPMVELIEPSEESTTPMHFYIKDPDRFLGKVSEIPEKGGFEIGIGSRQGVKPGMLFDVHRPLGTMNWFIGVLRVDRTMNDASETTLVTREGVMICPVTGRAVLDPKAKFSPYVYADGGKAVPLISAESLGLGGEMPVAGDRVDNPFFEASGELVFGIDAKLPKRVAREVEELVSGLGGRIAEGEGEAGAADYLVVGEEEAGNILAEPPHVTPGHLSSYIEF